MQDKDFLDGMDRLRATFGAQFYPKEKENLIAAKVRYLPRAGWLEIIDNLIMAKRYAPTPVEIIEETKNWQRAHPSSFDVVSAPRQLLCRDCFEAGWVYVETEHGPSLMICDCADGAMEHRAIGEIVPRWERGTSDRVFQFSKKPFPEKKFIPSDKESEISEICFGGMSEILAWWNAEKKSACMFWRNLAKGEM
jgi:hypothetical protein